MKIYKKYRSRRPVEALVPGSRVYLTLNSKWEQTGLWFKQSPMGKNTLGLLCRSMCERAGLTARHTNHSVRRTAVSNLLERGVHETKVQQLSGHKNLQSLNTYRTNSFNQQHVMSATLSSSLSSSNHQPSFPALTSPPEPISTSTVPRSTATPTAYPEPTLAIQAATPPTDLQNQFSTIDIPAFLDIAAQPTPASTVSNTTSLSTASSQSKIIARHTESMDIMNIINDDVLMDFANDPFMDISNSVPTSGRVPTLHNCTFNGPVTIHFHNGSK